MEAIIAKIADLIAPETEETAKEEEKKNEAEAAAQENAAKSKGKQDAEEAGDRMRSELEQMALRQNKNEDDADIPSSDDKTQPKSKQGNKVDIKA